MYAYSAMVSAYGRSGQCREALKVFQVMKKAGYKLNLIMYNTIIDATELYYLNQQNCTIHFCLILTGTT